VPEPDSNGSAEVSSDLEKHLADKVAGLAPDARRKIYDEVRAGLQSEIRAAAPFMPVQTVVARRRELENAIIAVERAAARSDPPRAFVPEPPKPVVAQPVPPLPDVQAPTTPLSNDPVPENAIAAANAESVPPAVAEIENQIANAVETEAIPSTASAVAPTETADQTTNAVEGGEIPPLASAAALADADEKATPEPAPTTMPPEQVADRPELLAAISAEISAATEPIETSSEPPLPLNNRRPLVVYAVVLSLVVGAVAVIVALIGGGLDRTPQPAAPVVAAPLVPDRPSPAAELIKGAGFQTAAQDALRDGNTHLTSGDFDRAVAAFDDAIRLDPASAEAFGNRAFAHWSKGDTQAAIRDYGAAIERDPANVVNRLNRAIAYNREGEHRLAIDDLNRVLAAEPANVTALNSRCWAHAVLAHLQDALADCDEALKLRPDDPDILDSRGFVYLRLGRLDRAIADYNAVLKQQPKQPGSLYGRGLAKIGRGDRGGGREDVSAARSIDPDIVDTFARYGVR
jgi:tetratricopeptide (TPR) repeat protein